MTLVGLLYPLKKAKNILKSSLIFIFITMAHTTQNSSKKKSIKKPTNYEF